MRDDGLPEEFEALYDKIDREMRSYITAVILGEEDNKQGIHDRLVALHPRSDVMAIILGVWFNMTRYLMVEHSGAKNLNELLDVWVEFSRDIEFDILTNGGDNGSQ